MEQIEIDGRKLGDVFATDGGWTACFVNGATAEFAEKMQAVTWLQGLAIDFAEPPA